MGRHGDWDGTVTGVTAHGSDEGGEPCALGARCYERDYAGNAKRGPRALCESDRRWVERSIGDLPWDYVHLSFLLARVQQQEEHVSGTREPPMPVAADIDAFMREIVLVALSWETEVRCMARLADIPADPRRMGAELAQASRTLVRQLDTLLSLGTREVTRYATKARLAEIESEGRGDDPDTVRWDTAGDAWEYKPMDGIAAALELLGLHGRARGMLGLTPQRRRITEVPCDECKAKTLVQREAPNGGWMPMVSCTACPNTYTGTRYDLLISRIYQAQLAALERSRRGAATAREMVSPGI